MGKHVTATQKVTGTTPEIVVHSRHVEISTRFREHVFDKLSRVDRFGVVIMGVDVEVGHEQNPRLADQAYEVELTCRGRGMVIRAESHAADKWAALDQACERLEERLRRAADRRHDRQ
jgi:ribosomal subunit interface protein